MIAKELRLKRNAINYLLKKGSSATSNLFILKYGENNEDFSRFCVIISKKLAVKAVLRNRVRRQIYEAIRTCETLNQFGNYDIILIPKKKILDKDFSEIKEDIEQFPQKLTPSNGSK